MTLQTFLPYPNFYKSASCLDKKRLNCQIKEANQIINIILRKMKIKRDGIKGWLNHPVLKIWSDKDGKYYLKQLIDYTDAMWIMADILGINRKWFQDKPNKPHYDICKSKKALAIKHGAKLVDDKEIVMMWKNKR